MSQQSQNLLRIHGAVLLFGLPGLFAKLLPLSPVVIVFGRVALASVALLLACALWRLPLWPRCRRSLPTFVALGVLLAVHSTTFFHSVQVSSIAIALITFSTFPVFVTFLEPVLLREKLRATDAVLACIALTGIAILIPSFDLGNRTMQGVLWGVTSGLTFALLSLLNRKCVGQHPGIALALYQDAIAAAVLLPFVLPRWPPLTVTTLVLLLILGVLCTAVAHTLFITGMRAIKARTASLIACLEPVYGSIFAALLLKEVPSARTLFGGSLVLGVALYATMKAGNKEATAQDVLT
jgi:drug/metabolite transporter (DMT)-like permease